MIYGYNSKLSVRSIGTLEDYSREFLEEIRRIRVTEFVRHEVAPTDYCSSAYSRDRGPSSSWPIALEALYSLV